MAPQNETLSTPASLLGPDDALYRPSLTTPGYPVRRKYPQAASERLTIGSDTATEVLCDDHKKDSLSEQHEEVSRSSKRLLPDRSHAAHNRANEKLVYFIVKQRMVEERLLVRLMEPIVLMLWISKHFLYTSRGFTWICIYV